jgi:hypothetical protein
MLTHQVKDLADVNVSLVQGLMPNFPFIPESFDAVVTVQSLSEVLCFGGEEALSATMTGIYSLLREGGILVVLDHQNPGNEPVEIHLNDETYQLLQRFQQSFEYRTFSYQVLDDGWIGITLRNLYEFITKIWSFDTALEREEMQETHTPYSGKEFAILLEEHGFSINTISGIVSFEDYMKRAKVKIRPKRNLPERFFLVSAIK